MMCEAFRKVANAVVELPFVRKPLAVMDRKIGSCEGWEKAIPVFLVGPPRSGTTLLYQILTAMYDFASINSLMNLFYYSPLLMANISRHAKWAHHKKMYAQNTYGVIPGVLSPDEGAKMWSYLLPEMNGTHYLPQGSCSNRQIYNVRRIVRGVSCLFHRPFLSKHPANSLRLAPLTEAFPAALCVVLFRDPVYNAQSLYKARQRRVNSHGWWACKPKEYDSLCCLNSTLQSVSQVYYTLRQIDEDRGLFGNRIIWISYEDLCRKPTVVLRLLAEFMEEHGLKVPAKDDFTIPPISHRNKRRIEADLFHRIEDEVDRIFAGWRPEITTNI